MSMTMTATSVDTDAPVDASRFVIPTDITFEEAPTPTDQH
jgi:hypothetical protein